MLLRWSPQSEQNLRHLPIAITRRIVEKMEWYAAQKDPLAFAKRLTGTAHATVRFRIGNYRVLCDVQSGAVRILFVVAVRHRKNAYQV